MRVTSSGLEHGLRVLLLPCWDSLPSPKVEVVGDQQGPGGGSGHGAEGRLGHFLRDPKQPNLWLPRKEGTEDQEISANSRTGERGCSWQEQNRAAYQTSAEKEKEFTRDAAADGRLTQWRLRCKYLNSVKATPPHRKGEWEAYGFLCF